MAVPGLKSIFDIAQHQTNCDFRAAKSAGLEAVIIKATQGVNFVDPQFRNHLAGAQAAGLMIGAYHFGTASDAVGQADDFLKAVNPGPDTLLALDYEENPSGTQMTIPIAEKFVARVHEKTGRFPVFYCGHLFKEQMGNAKHPLFAQCPLWLAAYVRDPAPFVQKTWVDWTLWQHTNGTDGPEAVPVAGVGACDRSTFKGTPADLRAIWKSGLVAPEPAGAA
jgi:lysozyme